jgi:2-succinyl-6-hydroxy-2,4-cyclohexadiene-1-carboxylate synthase
MNPLVMLHGFAGGAWSYDHVLPNLIHHGELLIPTLSYHESDGPATPLRILSFEAEISRIAELIAARSRGQVDLVGYSMGGRIAFGLSVAHPELVRRLVLISSRRGLATEREREERRRADAVWAEILEREGLESFLQRWWAQPLFRSLARLPQASLRRELECRRGHSPLGLAAAMRHLGLGNQPSYAAEARRLGIPVTMVAGDLDTKFLTLSQQLASELPFGRFVVVKGSGHHLLLEAPQQVARIINEERAG